MLSNATILVVGADSQIRTSISEAISGECRVVNVQGADEALSHANNQVDLVISDSGSAHFDGLNFLRKWKLRNGTTPFLMLVSDSGVRPAVEAMKLGAADCLVKPLDIDDLRVTVTHLISSGGKQVSVTGNGNTGRGADDRRSGIDIPPDTSLEDLERAAVEQALVQHNGNRTHAARTLGISVRTLQRKLKAWGMPIVSFPSAATHATFNLPGAAGPATSFNVHAH